MSAASALDYLASHRARIVDELIDYVRVPSISADPAHRADMGRAVEFLVAQLRRIGLEHVEVLPTAGHPAVYADWLGIPGAPTILVYGHYDVQPAAPLDAWSSPPFDPVIRDGKLVARGGSDNKGPHFIPLKVAEAYLATTRKLPINVKFLIEGEEEIGSRNLEPLVSANREKLAADFVLAADGARWRIDLPAVNFASRGIVALEATLTTADRDVHSGRYGGTIANALHLLARLVATLHDAGGRIAIAGFYDDVRAPDPAERAAMAELPFDEAAYLAGIGATTAVGEAGYSTLERQWLRPTLDLNGMWGGYTGPGSKTAIPAQAHAKISCRLVADQKPARVVELIRQHLELHCPAGGRIELRWGGHGTPAYVMPSGHPGLTVAERVLHELYGRAPKRVRIGTTLPVSDMFKRVLGLDTMLFSFSTADEGFHGPDEFFRLQSFEDGLRAWTRYWEILGGLSPGSFDRFRCHAA
ncbi:MAG: dipeptidase [Alphaproteobacteria bacterium]|nr:dipeptidase [Alphaproteobacteria bacterium]